MVTTAEVGELYRLRRGVSYVAGKDLWRKLAYLFEKDIAKCESVDEKRVKLVIMQSSTRPVSSVIILHVDTFTNNMVRA